MGINNVPTTIENLSPNKNRNILNVKSLLDQKYLQVLLESAYKFLIILIVIDDN